MSLISEIVIYIDYIVFMIQVGVKVNLFNTNYY